MGNLNINKEQKEALSGYFVDVAKGITLAVFGLMTAPVDLAPAIRLSGTVIYLISAGFCLRMGTNLLKRPNEH